MARTLSKALEWLNELIATPWAFVVAAVFAIGGFFIAPQETHEAFHLILAIVTFLAVFLLEHIERRDVAAMNVKLNALVAALERAPNEKIGLEHLPEEDVTEISEREHHEKRALDPDEVARIRQREDGERRRAT